MNDNENKKNVFLYAVIFFSCALIILIITGYSQIKYSKSINEFENIITNQEKEKVDFNINLSTALSQNKKLIEEIQSSKEELIILRNNNEILNKEIEELKEKNEKSVLEYEKLLRADELYEKKDIKECSKLLIKDINLNYLGTNAIMKYNSLLETIRDEAALQFFNDGYKNYKKENYEKSITDLNFSLELGDGFYFSDDCYFYIAYSYYRLGDKESVIKTVNKMLEKYSDSSYKKDALNLIDMVNR